MPVIVHVVGESGSGKTLLLEQVVRRLSRKGLRVAALKHSHHPVDLPGKDTDRLRKSGADPVLFHSEGWVLFASGSPLGLLSDLPVDVVVVEGYRHRRLTTRRFEVHDPREVPRVVGAIESEVLRRVARSARRKPVARSRGKPRLGLWVRKATARTSRTNVRPRPGRG